MNARRVFDNVCVGDLMDCKFGTFSRVVHAAKHPCFLKVMGDSDAITYSDGRNLYLRMVDADSPKYFPHELFAEFVSFSEAIPKDELFLIHCNQGRSRSPALAMVLYGRSRHLTFSQTLQQYETLDPKSSLNYGITEALRSRWKEIMEI